MPTIPRTEIDAVMERFDDHYDGTGDVEASEVRRWADEMRDSVNPAFRAEAADLDALADRYEQEANA